MLIAFRCDASRLIGSGHVMRCLTLADVIRDSGGACHFLCRDLPGNMFDEIRRRGHRLHALQVPEPGAYPADPEDLYGTWLQVPRGEDARESRLILDQIAPDRVIVDHYALAADWETAAVPASTPIMVIDDLADRLHHCDVLLDQNLGRSPDDYASLVPEPALILAGPTYALLRPEFATARDTWLEQRRFKLSKLMVGMGGVDLPNATTDVLDVLEALSEQLEGCKVSIILGATAPHLDEVKKRAQQARLSVEVQVGVTDMAREMGQADLAIGASGSMSWERCCLGLPCLVVAIADNQIPGGLALEESGAGRFAGRFSDGEWLDVLKSHILAALLPDALAEMSRKAAKLCDGHGVARVLAALDRQAFAMQPVRIEDARTIYDWRYVGVDARHYLSAAKPEFQDHVNWLTKALGKASHQLYMYCEHGVPLAHLRIDVLNASARIASISIYVNPERRGEGLGARALRNATLLLSRQFAELLADIHTENIASQKIFELAGFAKVDQEGAFFKVRFRPFQASDKDPEYPSGHRHLSEKTENC